MERLEKEKSFLPRPKWSNCLAAAEREREDVQLDRLRAVAPPVRRGGAGDGVGAGRHPPLQYKLASSSRVVKKGQLEAPEQRKAG
ncbi:hypothetical protein M514_03812 [Trichuris suis]|uniref:Uncharacterized protein n=1 Tax=Trichuris suis TaxID=68888 RepID=A0A085N7H6_9BILA|nr:hypothetical protein M513_03812 [Trichuris suis]KFD65422.1 hypothetical protein M514_03812 [Trichuris suis]